MSPSLDTDSTSPGTSLGAEQLDSLPGGRNFSDFLNLAPGVEPAETESTPFDPTRKPGYAPVVTPFDLPSTGGREAFYPRSPDARGKLGLPVPVEPGKRWWRRLPVLGAGLALTGAMLFGAYQCTAEDDLGFSGDPPPALNVEAPVEPKAQGTAIASAPVAAAPTTLTKGPPPTVTALRSTLTAPVTTYSVTAAGTGELQYVWQMTGEECGTPKVPWTQTGATVLWSHHEDRPDLCAHLGTNHGVTATVTITDPLGGSVRCSISGSGTQEVRPPTCD